AQENMRNAASVIDTNYYASIAGAEDISYREYNQRQSKDYLQPDQVYECEKYRIKTAYGMEVTEELVAKDKGGKLNRQIAALEAVILEPEGTITDPKTGKIFPLPPTVVAEKDRQERLRLPLSMDWGNYSAQWLARSNLGLADILRRLIDGEEITSQDPDLVQMRENALYCAAHVKAILGFKIPSKCKPMWLLGTLLNQLGLKLDSRKVGPKGKQVKHFRLRAEELDFALAVIKHRRNKRDLQLHRAVQIVEEGKRHQAGMESQYGIDPPPEPVSTPPPNGIGNPQWAGVNTTGNNTSENNQVNLDKNNNSSHLNLSHIHEISQDWEPLDGDNTPIANSLKMLREAIIRGAEAVKATVCSWTCERRWSAVFLLEKVAEGELRKLEQMIPGFYQWLG
ncbi:MAG: bifunctional DNA primase/helicase, partial [Cyanobacteria bacterium P01_A01_bin.83]